MAYDVVQLTENQPYLYPSISNDGSRVVFISRRPAENYTIWLYDRDRDDEPRQLSVNVGGDDRILVSYHPQISGNGQKIVFACKGYYTEEEKTGIYVYDIDSGTIRLVVEDRIPRFHTGAERDGEPGSRKYVCSKPSISSNGDWLSYIWTDYEYNGSTRDHWIRTRERLMIADISGDRIRGGTVLEIASENVFGHGILSQRISGDGRLIAFYAGGIVEGLEVNNLEMPPYETETHGEHSGPTCNVYCYVVRIGSPGHYTLKVVPEPDSQTQPLLVAHPHTSQVQSFNVFSILRNNPPSICNNGSQIALNAGFVMRAENTGIYIYEPFGENSGTTAIITFGAQPGIGPGYQTLTTGVVPAISSPGLWLAYYRRDVSFLEGYGDPSEYEEGETYCPNVERDVIEVCSISETDTSSLIETSDDSGCPSPIYMQQMRLGIVQDASHATFISRANKLYYATLVPD